MKSIKKSVVPAVLCLSVLGGCAGGFPLLNASGQPVKFVDPVLGKAAMNNVTYVLLEKSIADGKMHLVSISKTRQPIENDRQERIAFNSDLTRFAPDFTSYSFQTYSDAGNYGEKTVVMNCGAGTSNRKTSDYGPCSSDFGKVFVPMGVYKAGAVSNVAAAQVRNWENPELNHLRMVVSPAYALRQAGVFEHMDQLASAK